MQKEKKLSYYLNHAKKLDFINSKKTIKIALLSSFTINGLSETLKVKCEEKQISCQIYVGAYNQYSQEILNPSSNLYKFCPDLTFLILDNRYILNNFFYTPYTDSENSRIEFIEKQFSDLKSLIEVFEQKLSGKLIISNFSVPVYSPYGIFENKVKFGLKQMIRSLNAKLVNYVRDRSSLILDIESFVSKHGETNIFNYSQFFLGDVKISFDYIPHLANEILAYVVPTLGLTRKCIVLDLDNTLWGGIIGEDGFEGIELGSSPMGKAFEEFQKFLLSLYERGIILAINSKNNPDDVFKVLREHPNMVLKENQFGSMQINWNDKVTNMRQISKELNIGLDSMIFFDDDPVNREYVTKTLPEVLTPVIENPIMSIEILQNMIEFNVFKITDEDKQRGKMYIDQRKRSELQTSSSDLNTFLKELSVRIKIKNGGAFTIPRISQLTQKTNQFNLTTKRYTEENIEKLCSEENTIVGCAQIEDKFGDNGITNVFIIRILNDHWSIDTFLLSCRVMGRDVEKAIMSHILLKAKKNNVKYVTSRYIPTAKNVPCSSFLENSGFVKQGDNWIHNLKNIQIPNYITITEE